MNPPWVVQPARDILYAQRWNASSASAEINVPYLHLRAVLLGKTRPRPEVLERLPKLLGVPVEELFTEEMLAQPFGVAGGRPPKSEARRKGELAAGRKKITRRRMSGGPRV
ncbi:hypothetical protein [Branchiibius sp. NY16-3462-2]|uniref:hypothetical protein n=1 Tax=Branchiibius sp. NY16-3462-2 TaxID=1807500 RepID=UPI0025B98BCA|nr:hypothetical protein [Branchiibius sp. NY16-3462-2]